MAGIPLEGELCGMKLAGYNVDAFLKSEEDCHWYEAHTDDGQKVLLYIYASSGDRDAGQSRVHGYRTSADAALESTPEILHFINIGAHRLMMSSALRGLLTAEATRPRTIAGFTIERVLGSGFKGVTYEARRSQGPGTPYALKVTIAEEYSGRTYLPEVDRMVDVAARDRDHFPQIHECDNYVFTHEDKPYPLVYFVEDLIPGETLEHVLETCPGELDALFLYHFIQEMLAAIATLQACELMHDDLHAGNIMIHRPLVGRRRPYMIDFGSAKPRTVTQKPRDDIRNLASQMAAIANAIQQNGAARTTHEDRILISCEGLLAAMSDDDPMRRPEDAMQLLEQFDRSFGQGSVKQTLVHPFDFGNAEEVMDNSLLYSLTAKSFPWRDQIEASSHLLVIGPRGCGKTTVFRSMSFACLADAGQIDDALRRSYVGIYVSCNKEFRQRFSAIDRTVLLSRQDDIRHYFNLILIREFASVLVALSRASLLYESDLSAIHQFLEENVPGLSGSKTAVSVDDIEAKATRAVHEARMSIWKGVEIPTRTTQGFIADLAEFIASRISALNGKTLYLFVDDYTEGKVPKEAQQAINHALFVPNAVYKCKISSEVFGVAPDETFGNFLAQDREYREWNLGTLYCLTLPSREQKEFLKEIVDNRLKLCSYDGRVDSVIGRSLYSDGTLERALRRESDLRKEKRRGVEGKPPDLIEKEVDRDIDATGGAANYHGWDTICDLCTGDVSNILELLNRMFEQCAVKRGTVTTVAPDSQNSVIEAYARQYINKIKGIPGFGERMFSIVDAFGSMARRLLEDYPPVKHGEGRTEPYRLLRIELDEAFRATPDVVGGDNDAGTAIEIWKLLQRYCIFIDADESRSRRNTLSSRVILRRIFCPAFRIGLVNSECWTLSQQQWEAFSSDPSGRAEQYAKANIERALKRRGENATEKQGQLFSDTEES